MAFKGGADVYFELDPFELNSGANDPVRKRNSKQVHLKKQQDEIINNTHANEDEWLEKMFEQDADQFLSSIRKNGKIARSPISSHESSRTDGRGENRDDCGNLTKTSHEIVQNNDERDDDANVQAPKIATKKTRTPAKRNEHYKSSKEIKKRYPSVPKDSSLIFNQGTDNQELKGNQVYSQREDDTKLILDDLDDLQTKMDKSETEKEIEKIPKAKPREETLCELLWTRQWNEARRRLQIHSEEAQEKIKLHYTSMDFSNDEDLQKLETNKDTRSALPLHLACAIRPLPPIELMQDLINAYPDAIRQFEESSGMLSIHMASNLRPYKGLLKEGEQQLSSKLSNRIIFMDTGSIADNTPTLKESTNHENVINLLLLSNPKSIFAKETINGMTPLHIAASTTRAKNGIISPLASNVLNMLMLLCPAEAVTSWKDNNGMSPYDWAWRNVDYFCPNCGIENASEGTEDKNDTTTRCKCPQSMSVSEVCVHPFLRKDICNHFVDPAKPEIEFEGNSKTKGKSKPSSLRSNTQAQLSSSKGVISPLELSKIREYANTNMAYRKKTCKADALGSGKSATLHMKICLSGLVHPSNHGRKRRGLRFSNKTIPNPFFEVFAAHRCGISKSYYKSYPLCGTTEGTWEDAFLDLGLTHKQLRNGTNGASYIEVGIRVMHCPENGSKIKLIGTCQVSLETLQREQEERLRLKKEIKSLESMVGDTRMSLPEPEKHPVLKGFEVTGKLQVMSLSIE